MNQQKSNSISEKLLMVSIFNVRMIAVFGALLLISACGTAPSQPVEEVVDYVWPELPNEPVIRYLSEFSSEMSLRQDEKLGWKDIVLGKEQELMWSLKTPYGVHVDDQGRVLVADTNLPGLAIFDFEQRAFSMLGSQEPGKLIQPISVSSDRFGRIYVTDGRGKKVSVYDKNGAFLNNLGANAEFERPVGIAINNEHELVYVSDARKHQVVVFDFDGKRTSVIGELGSNIGQFNFPLHIALDDEGRLYIVDSLNFRVQIFDPDTQVMTSIGQQGTSFGQFSRPKGIAIDSDGNIYVSDSAFNNIQMFNRDGDLLMFFGEGKLGPGGFNLPAGLAVDSQDRIYVADQNNHKVQIFQYLGEPEITEDAEVDE